MLECTPGPWSIKDWNIIGADGSIIAQIIPWDIAGSKKEDKDNIKLISATLEMYDSCMSVDELLRPWFDQILEDPNVCDKMKDNIKLWIEINETALNKLNKSKELF